MTSELDQAPPSELARKVHVLVVHFNTPERLLQLLASVPESTPRGRDVVVHVLDNASTHAGTPQALADASTRPNVRVRRSAENLGFGEGVNRLAAGLTAGARDILWVLNPDTEPGLDCLDSLVDALDRGVFDIVSPLIVTAPQRDRIWFVGGTLDQRRVATTHIHFGEPAGNAPNMPTPTEFITGAAPAMYRLTWDKLGGFPPGYFLYWEDVSLSATAARLGLRMGVIPAARLWHEAGGSDPGRGRSATFYYWATRNRFRFGREISRNRWDMLMGRGFPETARYIVRAVLERERRSSKISAAIRGTRDGMRDTD